MPYILSPLIHEDLPGLWSEGSAYEKKNLYKIEANKIPPVNYDIHTFKSHSLTHVETSLHTQNNGNSIDQIYNTHPQRFYGEVLVLKLAGNSYKCIDKIKQLYHWEITREEIEEKINHHTNQKSLEKIFITTEIYPMSKSGFHNPDFVLTLTQSAADYLVETHKINLYGTSWKSSDYNPGSPLRPIHNTLFKTASIVECLNLHLVPEGWYFLVCTPLNIRGASESPVVPILFTKDEIKKFI